MLYGRDYSHVSPCDCGNARPKNGSGCVVCKEPGCEDCFTLKGDVLICGLCLAALEPECTCTEEYVDVDRTINLGPCELHDKRPCC